MGEQQRPLIDNHALSVPHSTLSGPWELLPFPLPSSQGTQTGTQVRLLPGHLLGFLPRSGHLDQVLQQGQPTFFDQQGAVLVSYKTGRSR